MKKYGIRVTLPETDPMKASHLLGENFESFRWFNTAEERDEAYDLMKKHMPNYRRNDVASQVLEKVER